MPVVDNPVGISLHLGGFGLSWVKFGIHYIRSR